MLKKDLLLILKQEGFSPEILKAFKKVRREDFIPKQFKSQAYENIALPLEEESTISQPSTIAFMLSLLDLKKGQKILELGSGSGYVLSLISEIIKQGKIYGLEINKNVALKSKELLKNNPRITIVAGSGINGLPEHAPFDRILVSAAFEDKKIPYNLLSQLKDPGILVAPIQNSIIQIKKQDGKISEKEFPGFIFVHFIENK